MQAKLFFVTLAQTPPTARGRGDVLAGQSSLAGPPRHLYAPRMASMKANARVDVAIEIPREDVGEKLPAILGVLPPGTESRLVSSEDAASLHIDLHGRFADVRNTVDAIADCIGVH